MLKKIKIFYLSYQNPYIYIYIPTLVPEPFFNPQSTTLGRIRVLFKKYATVSFNGLTTIQLISLILKFC
jgi:hypothetical protein